MIVTHIQPKYILHAMAAHLGLWLAVSLPAQAGLLPRHNLLGWAIRLVACCFALGLSACLCWQIAKEHRQAKWLQVAWWALAANGAISVLRMVAESPVTTALWPAYTPQLRGLWQHLAIVPANLALLLGVVAMCHAYHKVGLGFEIKQRDFVLMAVIAAVLSALMVFREGLSEANSPYVVSRVLQNTGLVCLALVSTVSVVLHRMAMQMGGGKLAFVLRLLTLYSLLRSVLVLLSALHLTGVFASILFTLGWQVIQWFPVLVAVYRAQMTSDAVRELAQLEQHPAPRMTVLLPEIISNPK